MSGQGPQRRVTDHVHPEYWTTQSHDRFEDRLTREVRQIREDLEELTDRFVVWSMRLAILLGVLAFLGFAVTLLAPFLREVFPHIGT